MEELKKRPVTATLILINILVFVIVELTGGTENVAHMLDCGASFPPLVLSGEYYRLFTCMFLHFGMEHLANNMVVLGVLGLRLEPVLGPLRLLITYVLGGLGGNLLSLYLEYTSGDFHVSAGASSATFALMGAVLLATLKNRGRLLDLGLRQVVIMAVLSLYLGFASQGVDNAAHVGGLITGFLVAALLYHPKTVSGDSSHSPEPEKKS